MAYESFRKEMTDYYFNHANDNAEAFCARVLPLMDAEYRDGMSAYEMKALQYRVIADEFTPIQTAHGISAATVTPAAGRIGKIPTFSAIRIPR